MARLLAWCRRALARTHLVPVAHALHRTLGADVEELAALRLPVDVLGQFPGWRAGARAGFRPRDPGLSPTPAGAAYPVRALRLQYAPATGTGGLTLVVLRDLLERMDPTVRFAVMADPGTDLRAPRALVSALGRRCGRRVRFLHARSATLFARDNARAARDRRGRPVLLLPRALFPDRGRPDEPLAPLGRVRVLGARLVRSRLYWQGGNLLHDAERCVVGADTVAENMARLGLDEDEVVRCLSAELGAEVRVLGDVSRARFDVEKDGLGKSGQASFHVDLDVALLGPVNGGPPVALLADPARGLAALDQVLARPERVAHPVTSPRRARALLGEAYRASARDRAETLERYRAALETWGYRVVGVPDLRLDPARNLAGAANLDFQYANLLPGLHRGRPAVYYLPWGVPALDGAAEAQFRAAGVAPVRASANPRVAHELMRLAAGLRCFCGPLG